MIYYNYIITVNQIQSRLFYKGVELMKKILSFTTALAIVFGCLTACGSSSDPSEENTTAPTQTTAEPTQATTPITTTTESITAATEPTYDFDLEYSSLSSNSFGDPEEFIEFLRCKLKLILDIDDLKIENVKEYELNDPINDPTFDYSCSFTSKHDNLPVTLNLTSCKGYGLYYIGIETRTQSIEQQLFQYKKSEEYNEHLCEAIIPLAVLYNCSSKEELLSLYEDKWNFQKGYDRNNGEKFKVYNTKIKTDEFYGQLDYSTGICRSYFEPIDFHYEF